MALPINIDELLSGNTIEWDRIEFKKGWNPTPILHSICAYANDINNWGGGYIILGVEEDKGIAKLPPVGLPKKSIDYIQKKIVEFSHKIFPEYTPITQPFMKNGKLIFIIWAPAGDNRPYKTFVSLNNQKTEKATYIKKGSVTKKVQPGSMEERRLFEMAARIPFDDRINHTANISDLNLDLIQKYLRTVKSNLYKESKSIEFSKLCRQMQIAKGPSEYLRPINAGLLLFNEKPDKFFRGARIEAVIHHGKVGRSFSEKIFTGPIDKQLQDTLDFIKTNIIHEEVQKVEDKPKSKRFYNYPFQAIEEVLANAVYHRGYDRDNPIEVQILTDRIEVLSFPGPLPPIDNKMLKKHRIVARDYRNRRIGDFLKELDLTEGRSTGFPIIYDSLEKNGSPPPIFETDDDRTYFLATIKIHPESLQKTVEKTRVKTKGEGWSEKWSEKWSESLSERQIDILKLITNNPKISRKEISKSIGINQSAIQKHLDTLKKKNIIKRIGPAKGGHWKVIEKNE